MCREKEKKKDWSSLRFAPSHNRLSPTGFEAADKTDQTDQEGQLRDWLKTGHHGSCGGKEEAEQTAVPSGSP